GTNQADSILLTSPRAGILRVETNDPATTVDGLGFVEVVVDTRDSIFVMLGTGSNATRVESLPDVRRFSVIGEESPDSLTFVGTAPRTDLLFSGGGGS